MAAVTPIAPVRIGQTEIEFAQGMRAGPWLFFTGHEATDFTHGIAAPVAGTPGLPLGGAPRKVATCAISCAWINITRGPNA